MVFIRYLVTLGSFEKFNDLATAIYKFFGVQRCNFPYDNNFKSPMLSKLIHATKNAYRYLPTNSKDLIMSWWLTYQVVIYLIY